MLPNGGKGWTIAGTVTTLLVSLAAWNFVSLKQDYEAHKAEEAERARQLVIMRVQMSQLQEGSERNRRLLVQVARKLKVEVEE